MGPIDIPYTKVKIKRERLTGEMGEGIDAYLFSAYAFLNRPLFFTAHTEDGAIYSGLTVKDFGEYGINHELLQPWGCLGERLTAIRHDYLKDYDIRVLKPLEASGTYVMSFMFMPQGHFEEDPEQMKTMHMIALPFGQFCLMPNNYIVAKDKHFTNDGDGWKKYQRSSNYELAGG